MRKGRKETSCIISGVKINQHIEELIIYIVQYTSIQTATNAKSTEAARRGASSSSRSRLRNLRASK